MLEDYPNIKFFADEFFNSIQFILIIVVASTSGEWRSNSRENYHVHASEGRLPRVGIETYAFGEAFPWNVSIM